MKPAVHALFPRTFSVNGPKSKKKLWWLKCFLPYHIRRHPLCCQWQLCVSSLCCHSRAKSRQIRRLCRSRLCTALDDGRPFCRCNADSWKGLAPWRVEASGDSRLERPDIPDSIPAECQWRRLWCHSAGSTKSPPSWWRHFATNHAVLLSLTET